MNRTQWTKRHLGDLPNDHVASILDRLKLSVLLALEKREMNAQMIQIKNFDAFPNQENQEQFKKEYEKAWRRIFGSEKRQSLQ